MRTQSFGLGTWRYTPAHLRGLAKLLEPIGQDIRIVALGLGRIGIYLMWYTPHREDK